MLNRVYDKTFKPCPFCGHRPILEKRKSRITGVYMYSLCCYCGANIGSRRTKDNLLKAWNTRIKE